jgi:hypothetical protein
MDDINLVEDIPFDRMNYSNELSELSEFDFDVERVGQSPLLELIDKKSVRTNEKRAHERFHVNKDAFALIRPADAGQIRVENKSMAEIACAVYRSNSVRFGRINNISLGGLSFRYITGEERSNQALVLDILVAESGFYLENLMFRDIDDFEMDGDFTINSFKMRLNRVQFEILEPAATMKLQHFVENYGVSGV